MTSIFVAKLDFGITSEQLKQAFQDYGTVSKATVATDRETGKSRGFGFVEMPSKEEAQRAIEALDGSLLNGRPIAVKEADDRGARPPQGERKPFHSDRPQERRPSNYENRTERPDNRTSGESRPSGDRAFTPPTPPPVVPDSLKDPRKKEKEKKKDWDQDGKAKKPKMNAYKKSGKNSKFFGDDDDDFEDDDLDLFNYKREEDEDDFYDDEED